MHPIKIAVQTIIGTKIRVKLNRPILCNEPNICGNAKHPMKNDMAKTTKPISTNILSPPYFDSSAA